MKVNVYVEVTQLAAQYEPVKIGIGVEDDIQPDEGQSKKDAIQKATTRMYDLVSEEVSEKIGQAIRELRGNG